MRRTSVEPQGLPALGPATIRPRSRSGLKRFVGYALTAAIVAAFVAPAAVWGHVDEDEGYYALAAKLVAHGKTPYVDFWFPQAPVMPFVYGTWERLFGVSWYLQRGLSVMLTVALGCMLYWHVYGRRSSRRLALLGVALFATTPVGFEYFSLVKTYALSTLLLFAAYLCAESSSVKGWFAAGVLLGLAVDVRLLFASVVLVFLIYARRQVRWFSIGLATGLLPSIWLFAIGPARFFHDTLASQTTRSHVTLEANIVQKLGIVARVLVEPHFFVLAATTTLLIVISIRRRKGIPLAVAIALMLAITNLVPTPSQVQYFVTLVPFLAVATVELVDLLRLSDGLLRSRVLAIAVLLVAIPAAWSLHHTISVRPPRRQLSDLRAISKAIDRNTHRGEVVMAFWPGYVYESDVRQFPGLESDFAVAAVDNEHLSATRAAEYDLLSSQGIARAIRSHATHLIIFGKSDVQGHTTWPSVIVRSGYRPIAEVRGATLYVLP